MKLFVCLIILSIATDQTDSNKELRESNKLLKKRLRSLTNDTSKINEEYIYNKEKLQVFIIEYWQCKDPEIKFKILEAIEYYCESILENVEVIGDVEGISLESIHDIVIKLKGFIKNHKDYIYSKDSLEKYNNLKAEIENKDSILYEIQQENSVLLGKLVNSIAELDEYHTKLSQIQEKIQKSEKELTDITDSYNLHIENLKSAMQSTVIDSMSKEKSNFKTMQQSQDSIISNLQLESEQLTLKLEQMHVENSGFQSNINLLLNKIARLEKDLSGKSNQLLHSEGQYEDFRSSVEESIKKEIENLKEAEQ